MLKPKIKKTAVHLLVFVFLTLPFFAPMARTALAVTPVDGGAGTGKCDPVKDWFCHGPCQFDKHPEVANNPTKVASCICDGTPNLTGDALASCKACQDPNDQNGCFTQNPITKRINQIVYLLSGLVAVIITANVIVSGIQYAVSGESATLVQAAKKRMVNSAIAFLVFILTFSLLQWLIPGGL